MSSPLARLTSRGGAVNIIFGALMQGLAAVQAVIIGHLLGPVVLGIYALATGGVVIGTTLKDFGISTKLVQERETDLYTAYGVAFTLELMLAGASCLLVAGVVGPILSFAYHRPVLLPIVAVLSLSVFTTAFLYLPAGLPYREMNFLRRNLILGVGPTVTFAVTVPAAYAGLGIWSLAAGDLAGFVAAAAVMFFMSSVRPHLVFDRVIMRRFVGFGGPLWGAGIIGTVSGWASTISVSAILGVPALGYFTLSQGWASQAVQVDSYLSDTLFPALCSIQTSLERQRRAFDITCRLSMGWAAPVGAGMVVFAAPLIHLLLGPHWYPAILLVQAEGAGVMINSIANSWNVFYAARGDNRPQLVASIVAAVWLLGIFLPLTAAFHLRGVAGSVVLLSLGAYFLRQHFLRRLFGSLHLITMIWREWLAAASGALVVELLRVAGWKAANVIGLFGQVTVFVVVSLGAFVVLEWPMLSEIVGSLRRVDPAGRAGGSAETATPAGRAQGRVTARADGYDGLRRLAAGRPMSFPLSVTADPDGRTAWVTTRDWPALGWVDVPTGSCQWLPMDPFPHVPTPDGAGGCWTALTRGSALAHVDASGRVRALPLGKSKELLVTALTPEAVWTVDAGRGLLWRTDRETLASDALPLTGLRRPDFVCVDASGRLWVADTHSPALAVVDGHHREVTILAGPHPTRAVVADPRGRGVWLGSSTLAQMTLVDPAGNVRSTVSLPGIPFGLCPAGQGVTVATLKAEDALAVIRPARREVSLVQFESGAAPTGCAVVGRTAVVALAGSSELALVDLPGGRARSRSAAEVPKARAGV